MLKYAKIVNDETKICEVGVGTDDEFYSSIGMTEMEVEEAYNGNWYIKGFAPEKSIEEKAEEKRAERNRMLETEVDPIVSNPLRWADLSKEEQKDIKDYRIYLLNIPDAPDFPDTYVMTFEEWQDAKESVEEA